MEVSHLSISTENTCPRTDRHLHSSSSKLPSSATADDRMLLRPAKSAVQYAQCLVMVTCLQAAMHRS